MKKNRKKNRTRNQSQKQSQGQNQNHNQREGQAPGTAIPLVTYKDRVFRMLFREKKELLELYNAMNGTDYTNEGDLTITTLENAIYMNMRNDVSFVLYDQLVLYEHQASVCPNLPLRDLFYVSDIYSNLTKGENLYSSTIIRIPEARFVVFYNGITKMPERQVLKLSDMFETDNLDPELELKVTVLNINPGFNEELLDKCRTLREYMILVGKIRKFSQEKPFAEAVERAVDECIREGVLVEFLQKNRAEVIRMSIYEYDEEKHMQQERDEAWKAGEKIGREAGEKIGREAGEKTGREAGEKKGMDRVNELHARLIADQRIDDLKQAVGDKTYQEKLMAEYGIE